MTRASEQWLRNLKEENPDLEIHDPHEVDHERQRDGHGQVERVEWHFDGVAPPTTNELLRLFKYDPNGYYKVVHEWKDRFAVRMREEHGPASMLRLPVRVEIIRHTSGEPDIDNLTGQFKIVLDALVRCGLLPDDDTGCVTSIDFECVENDDLSVTIIIEHDGKS